MKQTKQKDVKVTDSRFAMWRCAVALAWADEKLTNSEIALIHDHSERHAFSDEQHIILDNDLKNGVKLDDVFDLITDKLDRAHLINFGRVLLHVDQNYSVVEQKIMAEISEKHAKLINLPQVLKESRAVATKLFNEYEVARKARNVEDDKKMGFLGRTFLAPAIDYIDEVTG
jgi:hypothetical protein